MRSQSNHPEDHKSYFLDPMQLSGVCDALCAGHLAVEDRLKSLPPTLPPAPTVSEKDRNKIRKICKMLDATLRRCEGDLVWKTVFTDAC